MAEHDTLAENGSFLGKGWQFPVEFSRGSNSVEMVEDEQDIMESIHILLSTVLGERVLRPDYGANVEDLLFEPINITTSTILTNRMKRAITAHESRIDTHEIDLVPDTANGILQVTVEYTIIATNTRTNLVFPYYLNEATNIQA